MSDPYALHSMELAALLSGLGANGLYGLHMDLSALNRASIVRAIHDLSIRSLLTPSSEGFTIEPGLRLCLLDCINARRMIRVLPVDQAPICCYPGRSASLLLIEPDHARPGGWLLRRIQSGELTPLLRDKEYLPSDFDPKTQRMRERLPHYWKSRETETSPKSEPILRIELVSPDEVLGTLLLIENALDYDLIHDGERLPYSEDRLNKLLSAWVLQSAHPKQL